MVKNGLKNNYIVYKHISPSGKIYIGITSVKPEYRWNNGRGYIKNTYFTKAIEKYGWDNFIHEILYINLSKEEAERMEIKLISKYRSNEREFGYNISNGGETIGKHSEESKQKISEARKGKYGKGKHPRAKRVICENIIFDCIKDCAEYYDIKYSTMKNWLSGKDYMPEKFLKMGLRYLDKEKDFKQQTGKKGRGSSKKVVCNEQIFESISACATYYKVSISQMVQWLKGKRKMPDKFKKMGLRYFIEQ